MVTGNRVNIPLKKPQFFYQYNVAHPGYFIVVNIKKTHFAFFLAFFIFLSIFFWISSLERIQNTSSTESVP